MGRPSFEDRKIARDRNVAETREALIKHKGMDREAADRKAREMADRGAREADDVFEKRLRGG